MPAVATPAGADCPALSSDTSSSLPDSSAAQIPLTSFAGMTRLGSKASAPAVSPKIAARMGRLASRARWRTNQTARIDGSAAGRSLALARQLAMAVTAPSRVLKLTLSRRRTIGSLSEHPGQRKSSRAAHPTQPTAHAAENQIVAASVSGVADNFAGV